MLSRNELADAGVIGATLGELQKQAERLNLRPVVQHLYRMREHFGSGRANTQTMHGMFVELHNRLIDDLSDKYFLMLRPERMQYYKSCGSLFGAEVTSKFPSAAFDIEEVGKCFSLNRYTACVFHLMRTMEVGIRAIARCLQIPDPVRPAERNWAILLKSIRDDGIWRKWPSATGRASGDGAVFEALYASLDAVKNPWRNGTMHIDRTYSDDEAEHILIAVKGFMRNLASRCDENGLPLA